MRIVCDLPEETRIYAAIDGRVEFSGSKPWQQLNLFYPNPEDGWLIYYFHGDWEIVVEQGAHVKQGDILAIGWRPTSDEQMASFFLGRGKHAPIGFADAPLPEEIVSLWEE